jgi:hypothetical protein
MKLCLTLWIIIFWACSDKISGTSTSTTTMANVQINGTESISSTNLLSSSSSLAKTNAVSVESVTFGMQSIESSDIVLLEDFSKNKTSGILSFDSSGSWFGSDDNWDGQGYSTILDIKDNDLARGIQGDSSKFYGWNFIEGYGIQDNALMGLTTISKYRDEPIGKAAYAFAGFSYQFKNKYANNELMRAKDGEIIGEASGFKIDDVLCITMAYTGSQLRIQLPDITNDLSQHGHKEIYIPFSSNNKTVVAIDLDIIPFAWQNQEYSAPDIADSSAIHNIYRVNIHHIIKSNTEEAIFLGKEEEKITIYSISLNSCKYI